MFTVAVQKLQFMIAVIFAVFRNTQRDHWRHFSGTELTEVVCVPNAVNTRKLETLIFLHDI